MNRIKEWINDHFIIGNLLLIALVFAAFVIVSYFLMDFATRHRASRTVPDFIGLFQEDANHFAERRDLEIVVNDSLYASDFPGGIVLDQHPVHGTVVKPGRKVYITISSINQRKAVVPYVARRSLRQALNLLETSGFTIERIVYVRDMATNYVISQFVNGEEIVEGSTLQANIGSGVVLRVGVAAKSSNTTVPQLVGLTLYEAQHKLWETGLNVGKVSFDPGIPAIERSSAKVYYQSFRANGTLKLGGSVELRLALSPEDIKDLDSKNDRLTEVAEQKLVADSIAKVDALKADSIAKAKEAAPQVEVAPQQPVTEPQAEVKSEAKAETKVEEKTEIKAKAKAEAKPATETPSNEQ